MKNCSFQDPRYSRDPSGQQTPSRRHHRHRHGEQPRPSHPGGHSNGITPHHNQPGADHGRRRRSTDANGNAAANHDRRSRASSQQPHLQMPTVVNVNVSSPGGGITTSPAVMAPHVSSRAIVAEPPPPYTEQATSLGVPPPPNFAVPAVPGGGPARGHRKRKRPRTDDRK